MICKSVNAVIIFLGSGFILQAASDNSNYSMAIIEENSPSVIFALPGSKTVLFYIEKCEIRDDCCFSRCVN